jgi:hypothetical protein
MVFSTIASNYSLRVCFVRLLVCAGLIVISVTSSACDNITVTWPTNSMPLHIKHDSLRGSETIVFLPKLTKNEVEGQCSLESI